MFFISKRNRISISTNAHFQALQMKYLVYFKVISISAHPPTATALWHISSRELDQLHVGLAFDCLITPIQCWKTAAAIVYVERNSRYCG